MQFDHLNALIEAPRAVPIYHESLRSPSLFNNMREVPIYQPLQNVPVESPRSPSVFSDASTVDFEAYVEERRRIRAARAPSPIIVVDSDEEEERRPRISHALEEQQMLREQLIALQHQHLLQRNEYEQRLWLQQQQFEEQARQLRERERQQQQELEILENEEEQRRQQQVVDQQQQQQQEQQQHQHDLLDGYEYDIEALLQLEPEPKDLTCAICQESALTDRPLAIRCGHTFHLKCVAQWFAISMSRTCPQCRYETDLRRCALLL